MGVRVRACVRLAACWGGVVKRGRGRRRWWAASEVSLGVCARVCACVVCSISSHQLSSRNVRGPARTARALDAPTLFLTRPGWVAPGSAWEGGSAPAVPFPPRRSPLARWDYNLLVGRRRRRRRLHIHRPTTGRTTKSTE